MSQINYAVRMIEPDEAEQLLSVKRSTAPVRMAQVRLYEREMREGRWVLNGEPIVIGASGALLAGVLRLEACRRAGVGFPCLVIEGVEDSSFESNDSVRRRTVGDILSIKREEHGRALAAALAVIWRYASGDYSRSTRSPSAQMVLDLLSAHPDVRASVQLTKSLGPGMPHGVAAALHYLFSLVDADEAHIFFDDYRSETPSMSAVAALKRQLESLADKGGRKTQPFVIGLAIRAWEAARKGVEVRLLRLDLEAETLPTISQLKLEGLVAAVDAGHSKASPAAMSSPINSIQVELEEITPARAQEMLQFNTANRTVASLVVDKYARDMKSGAWALNGQTIKFAKGGRLLDGQHRLHACAKSGVTFNAVVVRGLDESVFSTFDLGSQRSLGDILIDRGEINTSTLAAVIRQIWLFDNNMFLSKNASPSISEMLQVLDVHPELRDTVKLMHKVREITAPTLLLALYYKFSRIDRELADEFMSRLADGAELSRKHPILTLRDQLLRARNEKKYKIADPERAAWVIKAWNAFVEGRTLDHIKWQPDGARAEAFPVIRSPRSSLLVA